jgi:hypothetical protein
LTIGEIFEVITANGFAKEHGLDPGGFYRLLRGEYKQTKGWKLYL